MICLAFGKIEKHVPSDLNVEIAFSILEIQDAQLIEVAQPGIQVTDGFYIHLVQERCADKLPEDIRGMG